MAAPLEVRSLNLPSTSARATLAETFAQWGARFPLKGYAVAFPFDAERAHFMPIAKAMAIACGLAIVGYIGLARLRKRQIDWRVPWAIFAAAWILLDLRWQLDLGREVAAAAERFWGKTSDEKALAADDAPLVALAQELRRALPPPPARVIVLCDNEVIGVAGRALPLSPQRLAEHVGARRGARALESRAAESREAAQRRLSRRCSSTAGSATTPTTPSSSGPTAARAPPRSSSRNPNALLVRIK